MKTVNLSPRTFEVICKALRNENAVERHILLDPVNGPEKGSEEEAELIVAIAERDLALAELLG